MAWGDRQLTTSLLLKDFGLRVELPEDRLCPPVGWVSAFSLLLSWGMGAVG